VALTGYAHAANGMSLLIAIVAASAGSVMT
jgi:hypothetical protein